jgi:hypothetical protein
VFLSLLTLTSGNVVDWQTLGWVLLAFLQFVFIVVDRVLYRRRSILSKANVLKSTLNNKEKEKITLNSDNMKSSIPCDFVVV